MLYLKILILFEMDFGLDFCSILIRMTNFFLFSFLLSFFFLSSFLCHWQQREKVAQEHCVNNLLERIQKRSASLLELYEDKDG